MSTLKNGEEDVKVLLRLDSFSASQIQGHCHHYCSDFKLATSFTDNF